MALKKINKNAQGVPTGEYTDVAGGTLYADVGIGTILPFGGTSDKIPQGFLPCNGAEVLKTDYAELYAVIGDAFGTASVNTKFVLPDLRGKFAEGTPSGGTLGQSKSAGLPDITGTASGSLKWNALHSVSGAFKDSPVISSNLVLNGGNDPTTGVYALDFKASKSNSIYGSSNTVQPPAVCVNYIIKAKMVALPADFMSAVEEAIDENAKSPVSVSNKLVTESELNDVFRVYEYTSSNAPTKASFLTLLASSNAHMDFKFINVVTDYMPNSSSYWYVQKFGGMDALHIRLLATDWVSGDLYTGDANSSNNTITWWRLAGTQV